MTEQKSPVEIMRMAGGAKVKMLMLSALMMVALAGAACGERLDKRFGEDGERGYRSAREFDGRESRFENRDRANFLGGRRPDGARPEAPRLDLQAPPAIGMQR